MNTSKLSFAGKIQLANVKEKLLLNIPTSHGWGNSPLMTRNVCNVTYTPYTKTYSLLGQELETFLMLIVLSLKCGKVSPINHETVFRLLF